MTNTNNTLLAIKGHIYEVSHFVNSHPGEGIANVYLQEHNRREVTEYFEKYHQSNDSEQELIDAREGTNDNITYVAPYYFQKRIPKCYFYIPDISQIDLTSYPNKSYFLFQSNENNKDTVDMMVKDGMGMTTIHHLKLKFNETSNELDGCYIELCSYIDNMENSNENLDDAKIVMDTLDAGNIEEFVDKYFTGQKYTPILKLI